MMGRFFCWLGWHRPPVGVKPEWSIAWCCRRCHQVMPGELGGRRR